jgi:hypothetical protein
VHFCGRFFDELLLQCYHIQNVLHLKMLFVIFRLSADLKTGGELFIASYHKMQQIDLSVAYTLLTDLLVKI